MITELLLRVYPDHLFAFRGRSLLIADRDGTIGGGLQGLYEHDLRLLSRYRLLVHGRLPRLDASSAVDAFSTLAYYVCPPTADSGGAVDALGLSDQEQDRQVVIRVARFVGQGLHEDVEVTNHGLGEARLELAWELAADFADLIEARGGGRQQDAPVSVEWRAVRGGQGELQFRYRHPRLDRGALVRFSAAGSTFRYEAGRVVCPLRLAPQANVRLCVAVAPVVEGSVREPAFGCDAFGASASEGDVAPRGWTAAATRIETSNPIVRRSWDRAVADLEALALGDGETTAELIVPAAGIPLYGTLFGRDALTTAGQALMVSPRLAEGALRLLARHLGARDDDFHDEQPGRVPQQVRDDPLALLGLTPWLRDYGDYAAPVAFLVLVGGHHLVFGDAELTREFLDPAKRVLDWLDERADLDGDGFLEYKTRSPQGQRHQGWKDSPNGVVDERGGRSSRRSRPARSRATGTRPGC